MPADLASNSAVAPPLPPIRSVLDLGEIRFQELLRLIGWTYCVIWLETPAGELNWYYGHVARIDAGDDPLVWVWRAQLVDFLQQYRYCSFAHGVGLAGTAMLTRSEQWVSGTALLQSPVPLQAQFFQDASIQTVVCIPYESAVLELGTTDLVEVDQELISRIRRILSLEAGPVLDLPIASALPGGTRHASNLRFQLPLVKCKEDTGSSHSSSRPEFSLTSSTAQRAVLDRMAEYGVDILGELDTDMDTLSRTFVNLPAGDFALRYISSVSTPALDTTAVGQTREQYLPRIASVRQSDEQELLARPEDNQTRTRMDAHVRLLSGSFQPGTLLLSSAPELPVQTEHSTSHYLGLITNLIAHSQASRPDAPTDFMGGRALKFSGSPSTSISTGTQTGFKSWTSCGSRQGKEKVAHSSLLRRCLLHVIPRLMANGERGVGSGTQSAGTTQEWLGQTEAARVQHKMAERRRRGKQQTYFNTLRSLVPNRKKKDKVAVLENTIQHLKFLKYRVQELELLNTELQYDTAGLRAPETSESATPSTVRQTLPEVMETGSSLPEFKRIEVIYDSIQRPTIIRIEIDITVQAEASDILMRVLAALHQMKLSCVHVDASFESGIFKANLLVRHEDGESGILNPDEVRENLRAAM